MLKTVFVLLLFVMQCSIAQAQGEKLISIGEALSQQQQFQAGFDESTRLRDGQVRNYHKLLRISKSGNRSEIMKTIADLSLSLASSSKTLAWGYDLRSNLLLVFRYQKESGWTSEEIATGWIWYNKLLKSISILEKQASRNPSEAKMEKFAQDLFKKER